MGKGESVNDRGYAMIEENQLHSANMDDKAIDDSINMILKYWVRYEQPYNAAFPIDEPRPKKNPTNLPAEWGEESL